MSLGARGTHAGREQTARSAVEANFWRLGRLPDLARHPPCRETLKRHQAALLSRLWVQNIRITAAGIAVAAVPALSGLGRLGVCCPEKGATT